MPIRECFNRRLIFVAGKGGVGRSLISASLGLVSESLGRRTALVELSQEEILSRYFSKSMSSNDRCEISPNLTVFRLNTNLILREFVDDKFHIKGVYKTLFDNRFVKYFLDATPGFNEFLIMSKIMRLVTHEKTPYDHVIVDSPATGHLIALLEVPKVITEAIDSGPLRDISDETLELITDKKSTGVLIASLLEEMPTTEALLIQEKMNKLDMIDLGVVINKVEPRLNAPKKALLKQYADIIKKAAERSDEIFCGQHNFSKRLKKAFGNSTLELPIVRELDEAKIAEEISNVIKEKI